MTDQSEFSEALAINTSYDRELVSVKDDYGIPIGETDIVDREELAILLDSLNRYRNYKYIVCDLLFDSSLHSDSDSVLYRIISDTPNLIIPKEAEDLPDCIATKAAPSGYKIFHHGEPFLKYQYLSDGEESMPLRMWHDLTGNTIERHWWGYSSHGRICNNTAVLDFSSHLGDKTVKEDGRSSYHMVQKDIYHLGADIVAAGCPKQLFQDKIILIGDFVEQDLHDTAIGQIPGIVILYRAYRALVDGLNIIPFYCYLILFIIFFIYWLILIRGRGWSFRNHIWALLLDWMSFTVPLGIFNFITMIFGGYSVNAVLIGSIFGVAMYVRTHIKPIKEK